MRCACRFAVIVLVALSLRNYLHGQDWPQWRGPNRDAKASGFKAPATWPKELTQKWKVTVGDGVATPALVGDKLFVFTRQDKDEVIRCLDATTGKEHWKVTYDAPAASGPAGQFPGPRSSPAVAGGMVVTLGVQGTLLCLEADSGKQLWRIDDTGRPPRFFTSCSPLVVDNLCIVQLGSEGSGGIAAIGLATGKEKWKWNEEGTAYASPVLATVDGSQVIVARTAKGIVGLNVADGKLLWQTSFAESGRGGYNSSSPVVDRSTLIVAGKGLGTKAANLQKQGAELAAKELWASAENSTQYNTPVVKDGLVFGISDGNVLFCIDAKSGQTAWTAPLARPRVSGYGSVVDAGSAMLALNPSGELVIFEPSAKEFKKLASYKVADGETFAYPVASGNRLFIKDKDSVALWTVE